MKIKYRITEIQENVPLDMYAKFLKSSDTSGSQSLTDLLLASTPLSSDTVLTASTWLRWQRKLTPFLHWILLKSLHSWTTSRLGPQWILWKLRHTLRKVDNRITNPSNQALPNICHIQTGKVHVNADALSQLSERISV
jgi:hypothetical protein